MRQFACFLAFLLPGIIYSQTLHLNSAFKVGGENFSFARKIVKGSDGSLYGIFHPQPIGTDTCDFDPGQGTAVFNSSAQAGSVLVKYNAGGDFVWMQDIATATSLNIFEEAVDLAIDTADNLYVFGLFKDSLDFDPGPGKHILRTRNPGNPAWNQSAYLVKYSPSGNFERAFEISGLSASDDAFLQPALIKIGHDSRIYLCGQVFGNADFDPDAEIATTPDGVTTLGGTVFIAVYEANLDFSKVHFIGTKVTLTSGGGINPKDILATATGEFYLSGIIDKGGDRDYDPGPGKLTLQVNGSDDGLLLKFDNNGDYLWGGVFGSNKHQENMVDQPIVMENDESGNIYIAGKSSNGFDADLNPDDAIEHIIGKGGDFIVKYNSTGQVIWARSYTDCQNQESNTGRIYDLKYQSGNIYVCGSYTCTNDFSPDRNKQNIQWHQSGEDVFVFYCDTSGNLSGITTFTGPANELATNMVLNNDGLVLLGALRPMYMPSNGKFILSELDVQPGTGKTLLKNLSENSGSWFIASYSGRPGALFSLPTYPRNSFRVLRSNRESIELWVENAARGSVKITLYDISGRMLKQVVTEIHSGNETIKINQVPDGLILVNMQGTSNGSVMVYVSDN